MLKLEIEDVGDPFLTVDTLPNGTLFVFPDTENNVFLKTNSGYVSLHNGKKETIFMSDSLGFGGHLVRLFNGKVTLSNEREGF